MKGIVFTEFLVLIEKRYGLEIVEEIIEKSNLPSGGAYTSVGTYDFSEMVSLLTHLGDKTNLSRDELLLMFGKHFFEVLKNSYSNLFLLYKDPIELLASIESHIHVEVRKIYLDAELPTFCIVEKTASKLVLDYRSSRAMYAFGLGLMKSTFEHYQMKSKIIMNKINDNGSEVRFSIEKC